MVQSYNIGMDAHDSYAKRIEGLREFEQTTPLTGMSEVARATTILKLRPDVPHIVLLLRQNQRKTWADFTFPDEYFLWRRARSYFLDPNEKVFADKERLAAYIEQHRGFDDENEERESDQGQKLIAFLDEVEFYNGLVGEVEARIRQFLQG